jgi:hypothetical protein
LIRELPNLEHIKVKDTLSDQLQRQQEQEKNRGEIYRRIAAPRVAVRRPPRGFLIFKNPLEPPSQVHALRSHAVDGVSVWATNFQRNELLKFLAGSRR